MLVTPCIFQYCSRPRYIVYTRPTRFREIPQVYKHDIHDIHGIHRVKVEPLNYTRASRSMLTPPNESGPAYLMNREFRIAPNESGMRGHECASIPTTSATIYDEFSFELRRPGTLPSFLMIEWCVGVP